MRRRLGALAPERRRGRGRATIASKQALQNLRPSRYVVSPASDPPIGCLRNDRSLLYTTGCCRYLAAACPCLVNTPRRGSMGQAWRCWSLEACTSVCGTLNSGKRQSSVLGGPCDRRYVRISAGFQHSSISHIRIPPKRTPNFSPLTWAFISRPCLKVVVVQLPLRYHTCQCR
jgi:hypothetical protein